MQFEMRKDRPCPVTGTFDTDKVWQVYVDNLDEGEFFTFDELEEKEGTHSIFMEATDACYDLVGAVGNPAQDIWRARLSTSLGITTDGVLGRLDVPTMYLTRLLSLTIWIAVQPVVYRRQLQVVGGRWVRVCQLRRQISACFNLFWQYVGSPRRPGPIPKAVIA